MATQIQRYAGQTAFGTSHSVTITASTAGSRFHISILCGVTPTGVQVGATAATNNGTRTNSIFSDIANWYVCSPTTGSTTVTWTTSTSQSPGYCILECSGSSSTVDTSVTFATGSSTAPSVTGSPMAATSVAIGWYTNAGGITLSGTTAGYTVTNTDGANFYFCASNPSITTTTMAGTLASSVSWENDILAWQSTAATSTGLAWIRA